MLSESGDKPYVGLLVLPGDCCIWGTVCGRLMVGACCGDNVVVGVAMVACRVLVVSRVVVPVSSCRCSNVDVMWLLLILVFLRVVIAAPAIATRIEPIVVCRPAPVTSISTESAMPAPLE